MKYDQAKTADLDPKMRDLLRENWDAEAKNFKRGLFLTGKTGTGKTYILHAVQNYVKHVPERSTTDVENWIELLMEVRGTFDNKHSDPLKFISENLTSKSFIFLDDVGAEKHTEWSQEILYLIVNRTYERQKPLFIATNLSFKEFSEKYGDRITSRLVEMCEMKEITGEDRRIN